MNRKTILTKLLLAAVFFAGFFAVEPMKTSIANDRGRTSLVGKDFVIQSEILLGLESGAIYPYIDTTPNVIRSGHIAITDTTENCGGDNPTQPDNIAVLIGSVDTGIFVESKDVLGEPENFEVENTGVGNSGQCVFHITFEAGDGTFPQTITDIVVVNTGDTTLTGKNTITASATVK